MASALDTFLAERTPLTEETTVWGVGERATPLRTRGYLGEEPPPLEYVTSVRGVM